MEGSATEGYVFALKLVTGQVVLVHPIVEGGVACMPCVYAYATTIRRAQGTTVDGVVLFPRRRRLGHSSVR